MNKKTVGIVAATVIALILIVVAVFALKGKEQERFGNTNNPIDSIKNNNYEGIDVSGMSDRLGMTEDELKDVLDTELEGSAAQAVIDSMAVPEIDYVISDSITDDGRYDIVDVNGDIYEVEDPFAAMTEEELIEYNKKMDELLDTYDNDDDDEADRIRADAKDIVNRAKYPKPDQDLIDAGFVATRDPNSDTGWSYENPNVVEDDTTGLNIVNGSDFNKTIITDPNELDTGLDDPYASYGKVTIGYGEDPGSADGDGNGIGSWNTYKPGGIKEAD